jgi:hypothetical protein
VKTLLLNVSGYLLSMLIGGRPMRRVSLAFRDVVTGKYIYYWDDALGRKWLADNRWGWFRIPAFSKHETSDVRPDDLDTEGGGWPSCAVCNDVGGKHVS